MEKIKIGKIVNAVGLKGEVKVYNYSENKERFEELEYIYINDHKVKIEHVRYQKNMVILKLEDINSREDAEGQKQKDVFITTDDLKELPEGIYYIRDIIGLEAINAEGKKIGVITDILQNTAQDLYEIQLDNKKKAWVPGVSQFILEINIKEGFVRMDPPEGLLTINDSSERSRNEN